MSDMGAARASSPPEHALRDLLRSATRDVHERLHRHSGLAAVQSGDIERSAYIALLCRLYGFHGPFETEGGIALNRTRWLESDLAALGVTSLLIAALPRCPAFQSHASDEYRLGARYVVEGSALGGRGLARQLDGLLGVGVTAGRQFFSGYGAATGDVWRDCLAHLAAVPNDAVRHAAVVDGATETFAIFEQWLEGWDNGHDRIDSRARQT